MENRQATIVDHKLESRPQEGGKRKVIFKKKTMDGREISVQICAWKTQVRRKKGGEEGSVMKAEDIEGYRGKEDIDAILSFIEAEVKSLDTVNKNSYGSSGWEIRFK